MTRYDATYDMDQARLLRCHARTAERHAAAYAARGAAADAARQTRHASACRAKADALCARAAKHVAGEVEVAS